MRSLRLRHHSPPIPQPVPHSTVPTPTWLCEEWGHLHIITQPPPGGALGQPHLLFPSSLRLRGHVWGLEKLHFPFNGGPLEPWLAEVKVRVREVLVFLL